MKTSSPKLQKVSVKDVARRSGTSLGTVSRVINGGASVSADARARVEQAILDLGYEPNAGARQMRSGRSGLIGILLPSLDVPFFGILAQSLEQALFRNGYHSLICNTEENELNEQRYVSTLLGQQVDGVIAAAVVTTQNFDRFADRNIPIIAVDRSPDGEPGHLVSVDHKEGGRLMAKHLLDLGHKDIAVVATPTHSAPIMDRIAGIEEALAEQNCAPVGIALGETHSFDASFALARQILNDTKPTAVIGTSDIAAIGVIHAGHELGYRMPDQLSVIGFDNLPQSAHIFPPLTTVEQPIVLLGELAAQELLHQINGEKFEKPDLNRLSLQVVVRASTAPPYSVSTEIR
ncbi:LacI family DNA-binding transcriptional regulator [Phaeobacter sp. C3_T13_0]|uniref:LacI family DNA-binding transcriptional regulator n=1 Tax=Phaeobacter cretensis TaxID=3342641 RepID=UPI0039BD3B58